MTTFPKKSSVPFSFLASLIILQAQVGKFTRISLASFTVAMRQYTGGCEGQREGRATQAPETRLPGRGTRTVRLLFAVRRPVAMTLNQNHSESGGVIINNSER
ncbi:hypothetical protein EYF80_046996 [Liparis tanakae]|uniref:Secreted protein n=1 Tax=Liparis tanakae TaxID=230148 RepID=A0A4Z2FNH9_9TELE|nr:hypothetical protein EYF80_046996 [Liparis tanakae]